MKIEIKVPVLPESVTEATLLDWHKKAGDFVKREEILIDLETDKVVLEIPAPEDGAIIELIGNSGDTVVSGQVIAYLDTDAKDNRANLSSSSKAVGSNEDIPTKKLASPTPIGKNSNNSQLTETKSNLAMPAAAKVAADNNIDVNQIAGSGRGNRVLKEDVLNTLKGTEALGNRIEERVPMTRLRKRVAERLLESQQTNAILTTFNEINMKPVMDLRAKYKDSFEKKHGVKLGFMSFFIKATIHALKQYPVVNASIDGADIVYHGYFDIGVAVGSPRGLVVPILRNAENMSIAQIEQKIVEYGQKAKDGKLDLDDLTGGTFSITNGGIFGSIMSTPIINPPQSAILGMHGIKERPVVENGEIVIRPMMYLALSYDHRLIDGREAVLSLVAIKDALEDPARLLLGI